MLIPAAALAVVGYLGAPPPHALVLICLTLCGLGITATWPRYLCGRATRAGSWCMLLSLAMVVGLSAGGYANARTALAERLFHLRSLAVAGRVVRVTHSAYGTRVTVASPRIATGRLDLLIETPVQVSVPNSNVGRGQRVFAGAGGSAPVGSYASPRYVVFAPEVFSVEGEADGLGRFRSSLSASLSRAGGRAGPLLNALVLGDTSTLDPAMIARFSRSGTLHLLALSGMHLGVFALLAGTVGRAIGGPRAGLALTAAVVVFYIALVGSRPGLVRAALLVAVSAGARAMGRRVALADTLAAAFLLHLVLDPSGLQTIGFQLSYLSLLGISTVTPVVRHLLAGRVPDPLLAPLAAGLGAQLATLPVVLAAFGRVSLFGSLATLVMAPIVTAMMLAGPLFAAVTGLVPAAGWISRYVLGFASDALEAIGGRFSHGPMLTASADTPAAVIASGAFAALVVLLALAVRFRFEYHPRQLWRGRI